MQYLIQSVFQKDIYTTQNNTKSLITKLLHAMEFTVVSTKMMCLTNGTVSGYYSLCLLTTFTRVKYVLCDMYKVISLICHVKL